MTHMIFTKLMMGAALMLCLANVGLAQTEDLVQKAQMAFSKGKKAEALTLLDKAIAKDPESTTARVLRAKVRESSGMYAKALDDFDVAIKNNPRISELYHERGCLAFKAANFKQSMADFDKYLADNPKKKPSHWQRGITAYYVGKYLEGQKQFEAYQNFDDADVENAVWRFMCMAKRIGFDKARADILKVGADKRVPMRQIYELFAGNMTPKQVLDATRASTDDPAALSRGLFYAHLYLGIFSDLKGDTKKALEHLNAATDDHRIGHYMWDVARVHRDLLKAKTN